jgi:hypothetical protein
MLMQTSRTSSSPVPVVRGAQVAGGLVDLVGGTPLLTLRRSGDGRVHLKLEGANPSGSWWDRVVAAQFENTLHGTPVLVVGPDNFAVSVAALGRSQGRPVTVVTTPDSPRRLHELLRAYGVTVHKAVDTAQAAEFAAQARARGHVVAERDDEASLTTAFEELVAEVTALGEVSPRAWVLPSLPGLRAVAESVLLRLLPGAEIVWVDDDGGAERQLGADAACRRTQTAFREGLLLSPIGAELVELAVEHAVANAFDVVVLLPEGGQRFLGWW